MTADYGRLDRKAEELKTPSASMAPTSTADTIALLLKVNPHVPAEERFKALAKKWKAPR